MTPSQLQILRHVHHEVGHLPHRERVSLAAGDVVQLLNALRSEERRADVAETRLRKLLIRAAEENLESLLLPDGPPAAAAAENLFPEPPSAATAN